MNNLNYLFSGNTLSKVLQLIKKAEQVSPLIPDFLIST